MAGRVTHVHIHVADYGVAGMKKGQRHDPSVSYHTPGHPGPYAHLLKPRTEGGKTWHPTGEVRVTTRVPKKMPIGTGSFRN